MLPQDVHRRKVVDPFARYAKKGKICRLMLCHLALDSSCELAFGRMINFQAKEYETRLCTSTVNEYWRLAILELA